VRVLLDENLPHDLSSLLPGHVVDTVAGRGWSGTRNGELLRRASDDYDVFLTMDRRLPEQQQIAQLPFGVIVLLAPSNRLVHLQPLISGLLEMLPRVAPGTVQLVGT